MKHGWALGLVAMALVLPGCGSDASSSPPPTGGIDLKSPAVQANGVIQPDVFCGLGSIWIPLEWGMVPEETRELAVYIGRYKYLKANGERKLVVPFADLLSKIPPSQHQILANELPEGASWSVVGKVPCPSRNGQNLVVELLALDRIVHRALTPALARRLTEESIAKPHPTEAPRSPGKLTREAAAVGRVLATYGSSKE